MNITDDFHVNWREISSRFFFNLSADRATDVTSASKSRLCCVTYELPFFWACVCLCVNAAERERERESITPPVFLCLRGFHSGWIRRMRAVIIAGKPAGRLRWQPVISAPHALKIPSRWHPFVPLPSPPFSPAIRLCSTYSAERISFLLLGTST